MYVEIVEDKKDENDESCDCYKYVIQLDELLNQIDTLREVISIKSSYLLEQLPYNIPLYFEEKLQWLLKEFAKCNGLIGDLASTFVESRQDIYENCDKYYHMKAYCKVAQNEDVISNKIAEYVGNIREVGQLIIALIEQEESLLEAIRDYQEDVKANETGKVIGKNYPNEDCDVIIKRLWPDILDQIFNF